MSLVGLGLVRFGWWVSNLEVKGPKKVLDLLGVLKELKIKILIKERKRIQN